MSARRRLRYPRRLPLVARSMQRTVTRARHWRRHLVGSPSPPAPSIRTAASTLGQYYGDSGNATGYDFAVARFTADGHFDASYNLNAGQTIIDFTSQDGSQYGAGYNSSDFPAGITIAPGDKVIVVGEHDPLFGATAQFAVARCNTDGSLDTTFNSTGEQVISVTGSGYGSGYGEGAIAAAVQADGKIVVAGNYDGDNGQEFAVARLLANGQIDNAQNDPAGNFNGTGYNTMAVGSRAATTTSRPSRSDTCRRRGQPAHRCWRRCGFTFRHCPLQL